MTNYEQTKEWRRRVKLKLIVGFGGRCAICKTSGHPIIFDFHHLNPIEKDFAISSRIRAWKQVVEEVQKCVMLCSNCHRLLHAGQVTVPVDAPRFIEPEITIVEKECPVCGKGMPTNRKVCSTRCNGQQQSKIDISQLLILYQQYQSYTAVGKILGVSDTTVKKHLSRHQQHF